MPQVITLLHALFDTLVKIGTAFFTSPFFVGFVLLIIIAYIANLLVVQRGDVSNTLLLSFFYPPSRRRYKTLRDYLRSVIDDNKDLRPKNIARGSQALISVNAPLDEVFIHLNALPDRPLHDIPLETQKLLDQLRRLQDLETNQDRQREIGHQIDALRLTWVSQQEQRVHGQEVEIEDVIAGMTAKSPNAIILGMPSAGKSTLLRWLALHAARACRQPTTVRRANTLLAILAKRLDRPLFTFGYTVPEGLAIAQLPILMRIGDYAKQLEVVEKKGDKLSFQTFLTTSYLKNEYTDIVDTARLAECLLTALHNGKCLLLLDGLDEVATDARRRQVADAIHDFINDYKPEHTRNKHYNRFIITSRNIGYEPTWLWHNLGESSSVR